MTHSPESPDPFVHIDDRFRPRRLRATLARRRMVAETRLSPNQLIIPHFVLPGKDQRQPIAAMPGQTRVSVDLLVERVGRQLELGLSNHLLFGIIEQGDPLGASAADPKGPVPRALESLKKAYGEDVELMADVCLCEYTDHGHCGVPDGHGKTLNDESLPLLSAAALAYARAGADWVAPSDMMDNRVAHIRASLDEEGLSDTAILSYSAKYASAYYGPFREAAGSAPSFGDRKAYQMDVPNVREAVKESIMDAEQGADALMVKPALAYLDVIRAVKEATDLPLAAYNVSGEYSMVKLMAREGLANEGLLVRENLLAIARAGADLIITYHGEEAVKEGWIQ